MDITEFDTFLTVCKYRNISRAAAAMFMSQQGLSKMVQRWERDFGVPLFRRKHAGIELTRFGEILEEHARIITAEYSAAMNAIQKESDINNSINVVIDLGVYSILTPDVFINFHLAYPQIELLVQEHTEGTNRTLLDDEKADLCLALAPSDEKFVFTPVYDVEGVVIINKNNPLSQKQSITVDDLRDARLIILGSACNYAYMRVCRKAGFEPHLVISGIEMSDPSPYIENDLGICLSFRGLVPEPWPSDDAVLLPFECGRLWSIGYLRKNNKKLSYQLKLFIDYLMNYASNTKLL